MVKLSLKKVSNYQFFLKRNLFCNYLTCLCRVKWICGKKRNPFPLTCLDLCRMLSIPSTGNVVVTRWGGVTSIQSVSYVAWCDQHFRGFCKWIWSGSSSHDTPHRWSLMCWNVLILEAEKWSCLQGINPLNHFPVPPSPLWYLRMRVQGWAEGSDPRRTPGRGASPAPAPPRSPRGACSMFKSGSSWSFHILLQPGCLSRVCVFGGGLLADPHPPLLGTHPRKSPDSISAPGPSPTFLPPSLFSLLTPAWSGVGWCLQEKKCVYGKLLS